MGMLINTRTVRIMWGDCDPAGIVYYPRYFAIFDNCTMALFERALGMTTYQFLNAYDFSGYPIVDTRARFFAPAKFGDDVIVETTITKFRGSSFDVHHRLSNGSKLAAEGFETRVWICRHPDDPEKIKAKQIPPEIVERFSSST